MRTKNLLLKVCLLILGGFINANAQSASSTYSAPATSTGGIYTTMVGKEAGLANTGNSSTGFGYGALRNNAAGSNSGFGKDALPNATTGGFNCAFGYQTLIANTQGTLNAAYGSRTMENNVTGNQNVAIGHRSLGNSVGGNGNVAVGYYSLPLSTGSGNIGIGNTTPASLTSGDNNIFIGNGTAANLTSGDNNVFIGKITVNNFPSTATAVGNDAKRTIILADGTSLNSSQKLLISENGCAGINIGNNAIPQNRLVINATGTGAQPGTAGLRFNNYTNTTTSITNPTNKVLSLNANGDVILVNDLVGTGNTNQTLSLSGNVLSLTSGGSVTLPTSPLCNLYACDGTIVTSPTNSTNPTPGLRTVTMGNNNLFFNTSASNFQDGTAGSGRIYIGNTMNSGSFPNLNSDPGVMSQFRLLVEGGILTERVKVALRSTANWADYVFANDYKLMSLKELDQYIQENKHLPGIQSSEELLKNGLDVADMQAKQMGKIEELTLHVIAQSKEIEELKAQVKALLERK